MLTRCTHTHVQPLLEVPEGYGTLEYDTGKKGMYANAGR